MTPQEENVRLQQQVNEELRIYTEAQRKATIETDKAAEVESKVAGVTTTVIQIMEKLYNAQLKYTIAMAKGQKGASQFNDGIDAMTEATQIAAVALSLLVPGGPLIKAVVAGFTFLATQAMKTAAEMQKAANDQADATYKAYQSFSKAGATAAGGMTGFFNDVNRMRLNVNQLDAIAGAVAASSKEISAFGGTVYRGQKEFADLVQGLGDFEKGMLNLGMNHDEQAEAVLGYMKIQSQLTLGEQRNYGNQSKAARKFIEEMEVMTRITGLSRKQQEEVLDRQMSNQRSGAVLDQLEQEGKTEAVELLRKQVKIYAKMGPVAEQGYNDILSGNLQTEAAQKLFRSTNGKVMQDQIDIMEGRVRTDREAVKDTEETVGIMAEQRKNFRESFKAGVEDVLIPFTELGEAAKLKASGLNEAMEDATVQVDKLTGATGEVEAVTDRYTSLLKSQNEQMLALQTSLHGAFSTAGVGVDGFMAVLERAGGVLMDLAKKALEVLGILDASAEREARLGKELVQSEMAGSSGEVGMAMDQGQSTMSVAPEKIKSTKEMGFFDKLLVGEENFKKRQAAEAAGQTPAQAAAATTMPTDRTTANLMASSVGLDGKAATKPTAAPGGSDAKPTGQPINFNPSKLLNYLGQKESQGQYDKLVGGKQHSPLTSMTVADVMKFQDNMISGKGPTGKHETTAVGKYQIIKPTMQYLVNTGAIKTGDIFDSNTQERAAMQLLKRRGMESYASGKISKEEFADRVATEWASMPMASGKSAHDKVGSNKASGSREQYLAAFARDGGIFDGPKSGYAATLHGKEAVIPLKDGAVPVSMSQEFNTTATNLGELVAIMKNNVSMQDRMLAVLEDLRRSQSTMADNTGRMAAYAAN